MSETMHSQDLINFTLNGEEVSAANGDNLIDACEKAGVEIPRFCYHKRMNSVGMCRMCIVEVDTGRGPALQPSCMLTVSEGMAVNTESETTKKAQDGVLEFLLLNHPLDCPICDKGGECPLQDQTIAFGPGETRFVEEKRHFEKPISINENVYLDRERCILCDRCTRFADEVVGDPLIHFIDRGNATQVNTFPDDPFASYFSGNVVQICPVGALTAKPYRFKARPWDLEEIESTYPNPLGDRITIQSSRDQVLRFQGLDKESVNWGWLTDKDRFSFQAFQSEYRVQEPLVRGGGLNRPDRNGLGLVASSWSNVLTMATDAIKQTVPDRIAVIGGSRLTNESQYSWTKLAKGIIGTDHVDASLGDELPPQAILGLPKTTVNEVCSAGNTVILIAPDLKEEYGTLYIRLRHAALENDVKIIELSPTETGLSNVAAITLHPRPGEIAKVVHSLLTGEGPVEIGGIPKELILQAHELVKDRDLKVVYGKQSIAESDQPIIEALSLLKRNPNSKFLPLVRRGNAMGAIQMGMAPGLLPGQVTLAEGSEAFNDIWPNLPNKQGMGTEEILQSAADGMIDVLFILGADPLSDFYDPELVEKALTTVKSVISVDLFVNASAYHADIFFPASAFIEVNGSHTNIEGRITPIRKKVTSPGTTRPDWMIAAEIANRLDHDLRIEKPEDVWGELSPRSISHANVSMDSIGATPEGQLLESTDVIELEEIEEISDTRPFDSYSLRLVLAKRMYDRGTVTQMSPSLKEFTGTSQLHINPTDFKAMGIQNGKPVLVTAGDRNLTVLVIPDKRIPRSIAFGYLNQTGEDLRTLLIKGADSIDIRIDPTSRVG
ncbi:MAG: molybdopterin-dependent oxidoreductase [Acidimicrobiales bacterium]|jgi:NADH-quinone oxidoreductase subunit G|nr:molybdopterin-dependent oxidoreductase [Acidimicrobiales bacterium]HJM29234.1 molybdopterin-dependent oxidoreductase [Acidimicrobiales bacterium]HJM97861.1 molybdopterin-dependent oxidoreductase [Acidimicrobiales bacterium]